MADVAERRWFDIGRVIERAFWVLGRNFLPLLVVYVLLNGLPMAAYYYAISLGPLADSPGAGLWTATWVGIVIWMLVKMIAGGALLRLLVSDLQGARVTATEALETGIRLFPRILGATILLFLVVGIGFLFLIVPGIFLAVMLPVVTPAIVTENLGVSEAFSRSAELTKNHRWAIFGLGVIALIATLVLSLVVEAAFRAAAAGAGMDMRLVQVVVTPLLSLIQVPVGLCAIAALYQELRLAREGPSLQSLGMVFD